MLLPFKLLYALSRMTQNVGLTCKRDCCYIRNNIDQILSLMLWFDGDILNIHEQ